MRGRRGSLPTASIIIAAALLCVAGVALAQPSTPGRALLQAAETARATVVVRVDEVTQLDRSGYAANVQVERVLAGAAQPGSPLRIGWEELAAKPPPRLRAGQRVLVALDDLPQASLWRQRFPDGHALVLAAHGDALIVDPVAGDVDLIAAYLQLGTPAPAAARSAALVRVVVGASPLLASAAVARLAALPNLAAAIDGPATAQLMTAASDAGKPLLLRRDIVAFVGQARLTAATPQLERLAQRDSALEAEALTALGQIRGLPAAQVEELLDRKQAAQRAVGARFATGALAERRLPQLLRQDPDPAVRAAAAIALAESHTLWGLDDAIPALADPDPQVRSAAAQALGALGAPAIPTLESVARSQPAAARGAITALAMAGPQGVAVVRQLAEDHPDTRLRDFARLALGHGPKAH
jgi:HEAT repeat protein